MSSDQKAHQELAGVRWERPPTTGPNHFEERFRNNVMKDPAEAFVRDDILKELERQHANEGRTFLDEIQEITEARAETYASPADNHGLTARLWDEWWKAKCRSKNCSATFTAEDVCVFNILQKLSRLANGTHDDSWKDVMGYSNNVSMLREDQRNR